MRTYKTVLLCTTIYFLLTVGCEKTENPPESADDAGNAKAFLVMLKNQGWTETEPPHTEFVQGYKRADSITQYSFERPYQIGAISHISSLGLDVADGTIVRMQLLRGMNAEDVSPLLEGFSPGLSEHWKRIPQEAKSITVYTKLLSRPYEFDGVTVAVWWNYARNPMGFIICTKDYFEWQLKCLNTL